MYKIYTYDLLCVKKLITFGRSLIIIEKIIHTKNHMALNLNKKFYMKKKPVFQKLEFPQQMSTRIIRLIHPYDVNSMICMISFYILPQCRVIFTITTWITFQSTVAVFMLTRGHRHSWYRKFRNISWILVLFFIRCSILKRPNFLFENFEACSAASPRALWKAGCFPTLILIFNQIRICLCSCATMNSATV